MDRLTMRNSDKHVNFISPIGTTFAASDLRAATIQVLLDRLASYEDAEEQGLLVRLIAPNGCDCCRGVQIMAGYFEGSFPLDEEHNEVIQTDDAVDFCFCPLCGRPLVSREEAEAALAKEGDNG